MENMVAHNAIIANKQVVDIGHLDIYSILSLLVLKHSQNMGCHQCDIINRLPHCCVLLSAGKAPDHPRAILHQTRRPDCGNTIQPQSSHRNLPCRISLMRAVAYTVAQKSPKAVFPDLL